VRALKNQSPTPINFASKLKVDDFSPFVLPDTCHVIYIEDTCVPQEFLDDKRFAKQKVIKSNSSGTFRNTEIASIYFSKKILIFYAHLPSLLWSPIPQNQIKARQQGTKNIQPIASIHLYL
jgi:hypothetical protein